MLNQNVARGPFPALVALFLAATALRYPIGDLAHAGPGLFPLMISATLQTILGLFLAWQSYAAIRGKRATLADAIEVQPAAH